MKRGMLEESGVLRPQEKVEDVITRLREVLTAAKKTQLPESRLSQEQQAIKDAVVSEEAVDVILERTGRKETVRGIIAALEGDIAALESLAAAERGPLPPF